MNDHELKNYRNSISENASKRVNPKAHRENQIKKAKDRDSMKEHEHPYWDKK